MAFVPQEFTGSDGTWVLDIKEVENNQFWIDKVLYVCEKVLTMSRPETFDTKAITLQRL